ncbi:MAG: hemerythrin family protein [Sulfuricella sp.]|nr:hemerythrin family protein [Sulfuricella sp.]
MSIVDWSSDYSINNSIIDSQHQRLFDIVNNLHLALLDHDKRHDAVSVALDELFDFSKTHFAEEERQMEAANFPGLGEHRDAHAALRQKILEFQDHLSKEEPVSLGADLLGFLISTWLFSHVLGIDKKFAHYLKH